jgi:hypothetical protein
MDKFETLTNEELNLASGGMDCRTAIAVSQAYTAAAGVMSAVGDQLTSMLFSGRAQGVIDGGCPK